MKKSELREIVKNTILENRPQEQPSRQAPDREVIEKPDTAPEKPTRRRTLTPPDHAPTPRPKAEGVIKESEEDLINKIAQRFAKASKTETSDSKERAIQAIIQRKPAYTREELEYKSEQDLAQILQGLMRK